LGAFKRQTRKRIGGTHMSNSWVPIIKPSLNTLKEVLDIALKRLSTPTYNQLISALIAELLKQHPAFTPAEARKRALEVIVVSRDIDFFRK